MHTKESLKGDIRRLGFKPTDTVLIHSSMKSIGEVEGRADTVLDAWMEYLGDEGLLVFPTLTWSNVNDKQPIFDVRETPSVVGILPQLFRQRPGVIRSLHPTHSLAAFGREAAAFTYGHERFDSPAGEFSPWRRLPMCHAKILFLGATIDHNTMLHGAEEWGKAPNILTEWRQPLEVVDYEGHRIASPQRRHVGGHSQYYDRLGPHFKAIGALTEGYFGDAHCVIMDAFAIAHFVMDLLVKYPRAFDRDWISSGHENFFAEYYQEVFGRALEK